MLYFMISPVAFIFRVHRAGLLQPGPAWVPSQVRLPALPSSVCGPMGLPQQSLFAFSRRLHPHWCPPSLSSVLSTFSALRATTSYPPPRAWLHLHSACGPMRTLAAQLTQKASGKSFLISCSKADALNLALSQHLSTLYNTEYKCS